MDHLIGNLSDLQQQRMLEGPDPAWIKTLQGNSYIPQHHVRAELTRVFGIGRWDSQVIEMVQLYEDHSEDTVNNQKKWRWHVGYRCGVRLRIRDSLGYPVAEFIEYHAEENIHPTRGEAHAGAVTSCESYALRRAAIGLGDRFGLSLYNDGSTTPFVRGTLPMYEDQKRREDATSRKTEPATEAQAVENVTAALDATPAETSSNTAITEPGEGQ